MNRPTLEEQLHLKLIAIARRQAPGDHVPYAFAPRVMAQLFAARQDDWSAVTRALWWVAGACSAIALAMTVWTSSADPAGGSFADDLEQTILVSLDSGLEADMELLR